jgi:hypothetical protein
MLAAVRPWAIVFVLGGMLGFLLSAIGGEFVEERALFGPSESASSRRYMISLLESEPQTLIALSPKTDVVNRALQFRGAEEAQGAVTPLSLTYLGGRTAGSLSVHIYALELRSNDGRRQFFPLALTLLEGKVIRRE